MLELINQPGLWTAVITVIATLIVVTPMYKHMKRLRGMQARMHKSVEARVTAVESSLVTKENEEIWVDYTFTVDGKAYTGSGTCDQSAYQRSKSVTVFYDPDDPTKNGTARTHTQLGFAGKALGIGAIAVIAIIVYLILTIVLA